MIVGIRSEEQQIWFNIELEESINGIDAWGYDFEFIGDSDAGNYITQGVVGIFGCNEGSTTGTGNAIKASGNANIIGVGFDKSDAIMNLINDGYLLCTMAQNPDVMGEDGVKAAVAALEGQDQGGKVTDTGVSVIKK